MACSHTPSAVRRVLYTTALLVASACIAPAATAPSSGSPGVTSAEASAAPTVAPAPTRPLSPPAAASSPTLTTLAPAPSRGTTTAAPTARPTLRSDFPLTFLESFLENTSPGTTGYRFVVGTGVAPEGANTVRARLPDGCRPQPPFNCTWQFVFTRSPLVAELFVPSDLPVGEYVFGFTLQDGRSADTVFSISPATDPARSAACVQPTRAAIPAGALLLATDFPAICSGTHEASDASIAAGISELLVATNDAFALYDKGGRLIDRVASLDMFSSVMSSAGYGWGDPRALFDRQAQRYFLAFTMRRDIAGRGPCECDLRWLLAVSRTAAPTSLRPSDWYLYTFDGTLEGGKPTSISDGDFLVMATDARNLVLHANMAASPSSDKAFTKLWVFDKARLLSGSPVTGPDSEFVDVHDPLTGGSLVRLLPTAMSDDPGRVFLVGRSTSGCSLVVAAVSGSAESAELTVRGVPVPGVCRVPPHSPQFGGGTPIWSVQDAMGQPSYAAGRIWLTHAVSASTATGSVGGIRLVELDVSRWPATPSVATDTTFAEPGVWYSFPALAADAQGDVAVVVTRSNFTEYGSVWYTGRLGTDPPSILRPAVLLKRGEANLNRLFRASQPASGTFNKFADFAGAALDPQDGSAWFIGTYVANVCAWGTWVGHVDWTVALRDTGAAPPPLPLRTGPPCPELRPALFTLQFSGTAAGSAYPSAPPGARAYLFTFSGADLADRALAPSVIDTPNAGWVVSAPGTFVLFLREDTLPPGSYQLRVRLADGRETGAFFTVMPP